MAASSLTACQGPLYPIAGHHELDGTGAQGIGSADSQMTLVPEERVLLVLVVAGAPE